MTPAPRNHPAEDAHPAPAAPVAVPEGGWRDGDQVAVLHGPHLRVLDRRPDGWFWSGDGQIVRGDDAAIEELPIVHVHAPRENARPEPVVAPLPSEAVLAAGRAAQEAIDSLPYEREDYSDEHTWRVAGEAALTAALPHLRLVSEDDEDTVRVPREVAQYAAAYIGEADHQEALDVASAIESALGGAR